jgi:hypothetical protein
MDGAGARSRLVFAGVLAFALLVGVVVVVATSGEGASGKVPADSECVEAWNADPAIVRTGVHLFRVHRYESVEVARLAEDGGPLTEGERGSCAVVFAAQALDPEQIAAAQVLVSDTWVPLSSLPAVTEIRLGELQAHAVGGANAELDEAGRLQALD